ncbi:HAD family hydrolase [Ferviditalea candida]|uniref:HAD family hydrolase n=1 Tax=Ferviditalea candida TaxID=3108399 RepID=A0ABU5ZDI9_9BACL|nr:HAD family hydrolase [Paenibacillaceae bacterium T2]
MILKSDVLPEAMIFDLDGTLFETESVLLEAYHKAFDRLRQEGFYEGETPPQRLILSSLGMLLEQIWEVVLPAADSLTRQHANDWLLHYQLELLNSGKGRMYPGVLPTLRRLKDMGIRLFVASNGLEEYVKAVIRSQGMSRLFEGLYSAGEFQSATKADLVGRLLGDFGITSAWMIGDRKSDVEAGAANGLVVVGCQYSGFSGTGELAGAQYRISAFSELESLLP